MNHKTKLLSKSKIEIKELFKKRKVNHPILQEKFIEVMEKIKEPSEGKVYLVYGPTGVGKSTLCHKINIEFLKFHQNLIQDNKGVVPIVSLELPSPDNGKFNWKDFYKRMLIALNEPLIDYKISSNNTAQYHRSGQKKHIPNYLPSTAPELRESLENAIIHRKTSVILLDEAQHLLKVVSGKNIQDQMDAIKSLANLTKSTFVLFGTYELMDLFDLNGQLGRRTDEIHFTRYNVHNPEELQQFKNVINTLNVNLPLDEDSNLNFYFDFLYERTIGCVGILKEWLNVCLIDATNNNLPKITNEILKKHAPSPSKSLTIAQEIINGEDKVKQQHEKLFQLQNLLKIPYLQANENDEKIETLKYKKRDVGKRNPTRDKVGLTENEI